MSKKIDGYRLLKEAYSSQISDLAQTEKEKQKWEYQNRKPWTDPVRAILEIEELILRLLTQTGKAFILYALGILVLAIARVLPAIL